MVLQHWSEYCWSIQVHVHNYYYLSSGCQRTRILLQKYLALNYWWARQYPVIDAAAECEVSRQVAIDVYQWLREICGWRLLNHDDLSLWSATSFLTTLPLKQPRHFQSPTQPCPTRQTEPAWYMEVYAPAMLNPTVMSSQNSPSSFLMDMKSQTCSRANFARKLACTQFTEEENKKILM